ncbi:hypothetical protein MicB006_3088 [Micromonospora sp. B006]|nr:hypothetical protein MicB006_3088 [Micromonospora sp. B006]
MGCDLSGDDTAVLPASANRQPAEPYALVFADGELVSLRVVAVVTDDSIPGDLLLPRSVVRAHDLSALTSAVYVQDRIDPPIGAGSSTCPSGRPRRAAPRIASSGSPRCCWSVSRPATEPSRWRTCC